MIIMEIAMILIFYNWFLFYWLEFIEIKAAMLIIHLYICSNLFYISRDYYSH